MGISIPLKSRGERPCLSRSVLVIDVRSNERCGRMSAACPYSFTPAGLAHHVWAFIAIYAP